MKIIEIKVNETEIRILTDTPKAGDTLEILSPALREKKTIDTKKIITDQNGEFVLPRTINGRDGLYLAYKIGDNVHYADIIDFAEYNYDYPYVETKKGLQVVGSMIDDAVSIGVRHAAYNVCIGDLMRSDEAGCIPFTHDGVTYYFDKEAVGDVDRSVKKMSDNGIIVSLILLCSKAWTRTTPADMEKALLHPDYVDDRANGGGLLSAFNVMSDMGVGHYCAFIAFLAQRYCNPESENGRAYGMIISNEVNSHWIWGNAGEKSVGEFAREYTSALRLAWQAATSVWNNARIYISLDHFWTGSQNLSEPLKYTGSRYLMEEIASLCHKEGEVGWNVAFHPYPENLFFPDFWNDESATFSPDTIRVTFKNLTVLRDFLYREENLYRGERRRIILSEQGFNSHWTEESEILQACAYGRAYKEIMQIPEIDSFILHAHCDNAGEFGLNLGIWRRNRDKDGLDAPKPIYYVMRAIDKIDEKGKYHWERY